MAYSSSLGDISLVDYSATAEGFVQDDGDKKDGNDVVLDKKAVEDLADTLLRGRFLLTALEFHAELQEAGFDLPKLRQFFSNPANVDQKGRVEHSLCRSPSQQTFDSIEFDRVSDVNNTEQDRVAVLEYELRKAKETIKRLRENMTVQNAAENVDVPVGNGNAVTQNNVEDVPTGPVRPMELLERRAINFLVNEYVLKNGCKMTAVTFSEENTDQDFDDWDDVGLNTPRPPTLLQIYRRYLHCRPSVAQTTVTIMKQDAETNTVGDYKAIDVFTNAANAEKQKNESLQNKVEEIEQRLRKAKQDSEREISRLMFENERLNDEVKRLKKLAALQNTSGLLGEMKPDMSSYSLASTTGMLDDADQRTLQSNEGSACLKVKAEPCQHFPLPLVSKILSTVDHRERAVSQTGGQESSISPILQATVFNVHEELEKLKTSFSPYDCTLSWQFYSNIKKSIPAGRQEEVVPFLVWLMLRTTGDQREDITQELISLFGSRCSIKHVKLIVTSLLCYAELANIQEVQSHLLAVCWEQINDRDPSRRLMVAFLCGPLACYLEPQIRSSLLFSILSQLLSEDKDSAVRLAALDSLVQTLIYLDDYDKLSQLTDLYNSIVSRETDEKILHRAQTIFLPSLILWAGHSVTSFMHLIYHVVKQIQSAMSGTLSSSSEQLLRALGSFYSILPVVVYRCLVAVSTVVPNSMRDGWHADITKLPRTESDVFEWSVLEPDQLQFKKLLEKLDAHVAECIERAKLDGADHSVFITNLAGLIVPPLGALCQEIFPFLIQLASKISYAAKAELAILSRIICFLAESMGPNICTGLLAPLFIQHVFSIEEKLGAALVKSESLAHSGFVAVYAAFLGCCPLPMRDEISPLLLDCIVALSTSQRDLAPVLTAFSMLAPLPQLQLLLSVVWDCVVHDLPAVRSSAARLSEHLIGLVDTSVLSSRLFSALVTLSHDGQLSVRTATLAPLVALLTQTENSQLLEKVYFQLQQVLDDPQCANSPTVHIRAIELFTQIIPNVDAKFRDEFILQRFAVMAAQNNHCSDKASRQLIAEALLNAYNTANCCYIPESVIRRLVVPALKCLQVDMQTMGLKKEEDRLNILTKEVESKLTGTSSGSANPGGAPVGFSLPVIGSLVSSTPGASVKDRTASVASVTGSTSTTSPATSTQPPPPAAFGSIIPSGSAAVAAAEAAKNKLAKFKQQSKTFFNNK